MTQKTFIIGLLIFTIVNFSMLFLFTNRTQEHNSGGAEASTKAQVQEIRKPKPNIEKEKEQRDSIVFPIKGKYWKTSPFGIRVSPFTNKNAIHYGIDLGAPEGTEIVAVKDGIIVTHWPPPDGYYKGHSVYGGFVEILHDDGISRYAHLSETGNFKEGDHISQGMKVGIIGNTGMTIGKTGRHLHFEYIKNPKSLFTSVD